MSIHRFAWLRKSLVEIMFRFISLVWNLKIRSIISEFFLIMLLDYVRFGEMWNKDDTKL